MQLNKWPYCHCSTILFLTFPSVLLMNLLVLNVCAGVPIIDSADKGQTAANVSVNVTNIDQSIDLDNGDPAAFEFILDESATDHDEALQLQQVLVPMGIHSKNIPAPPTMPSTVTVAVTRTHEFLARS